MFSRAMSLAAALVLTASAASAAPSSAATPAPPSSAPGASPAPPPAEAWVAGYKNGFVLQSEDGDFVLRITGYTHADGRFALDDRDGVVTDAFLLRRIRPIVQGTVARYFDFAIAPDFGGGTSVLQDGYLDVRFTPKLRFRVGKMKVPLGLERLQSAQHMLFVERALTNNLVPNRDVGVQVHGELAGGVVAYQAGVFDGAPDGGSVDTDTSDAKDVAARLFVTPWKANPTSPLRGLGVGFASTSGDASGAPRGYTSVSQAGVYSYLSTVVADGNRRRLSPQASFHGGPVGVLAEYVRAFHHVSKAETGAPAVDARLAHTAWSVTASYLLTGEDASFGAVTPRSLFVPQSGTWGAVQLVGRINRLTLDPDSFPLYADPSRSVREATAWGLGLNWIWNGNLKCAVDYEQTSFKGGAARGGDRRDEKSVQSRLHLSF